MIKASEFLQEYANTPVKQIDEAAAVKNLQRLGILTKKKQISAKYSGILVKTINVSKASPRSNKDGKR